VPDPLCQYGAVDAELSEPLARFDSVSLETLDRRAALLHRVDNKYAVERDALLRLMDELHADHEVLEIDGRRDFAYRTTYFETPDLRCFTDHVEGHLPRFKARTRLYADTGACVFEVKLKLSDDETDKRQIDHDPDDSERMTKAARRCLEQALDDASIQAPPEFSPRLHTAFQRVTFGAREGSARLTCDLGVRLSEPGGETAQLRGDLVLVETKTEDGHSHADRLLARMGHEPVSLSKYRVGMSLVGSARGRGPQPGSELFGQPPRG
jgi:hypothetical protein